MKKVYKDVFFSLCLDEILMVTDINLVDIDDEFSNYRMNQIAEELGYVIKHDYKSN